MNVDNIKYAIEVMEKAENLYMGDFQCEGEFDDNWEDYREADTIEKLHACGNRACFIGYLCLTDVWKKFFSDIGAVISYETDGTVCFRGLDNSDTTESLSTFLDIHPNLADALVFGKDLSGDDFYPVMFQNVKPEHVIAKLELILSGELS